MASTSYNEASSTPLPTRWDVFLSFRGIDTRYTFTDYLYDALHRTGIQTFRDDPELRSGDVISEALLQTIHDSKTYIVIRSKNYASSAWCLDELVDILSCYESMKRSVIVVFYMIDQSVVRYQTGRSKKAFEKHQDRFDTDRLAKWRVTLKNLANLSGYNVRKNMSQADIINKVVDRVLLEINPLTLDVAKYPVGLDSRVKDITKLLSSDTEGVIRIGIHGMGGIGKPTLAKAVYNENYHLFQGSGFLANVREVSVTEKGIVCLQQQLINDVLKCKNINIDNADQGIVLIKARICLRKVLIIIDDLDDPKPLEFLEGPFAFGSIIIITTRNEDLLDSIKVEAKYKVNELGEAESRQLFTQHAFSDDVISETFMELSKEVVKRAGGLPLALKVFGSNLLNQSEEGWRWYIDKLKRVSIDDVEKKLLVSFVALKLVNPMLQDIFLDIACFCIGGMKENAVKILGTCYTFVNHNIDILQKRCLLTINNKDVLGMHDLLRDMGREIARNNSPDEPGKHTRLWVSTDICDVLKKQKGTEAIEGIIPAKSFKPDALKEVSFTTETFRRMSKLRFLYLKNVNLTGSFEHKFDNLRVLCWHCCPLKCLSPDFYPQKLVILTLPHSKIRKLWELNVAPHVFEMLKSLNLSYSLDLTTTPDFSNLPSIESLNLMGCESLEEIHISVGSLARLSSLNLNACVKLRSLQETICNLRALEVLNIGNCRSLKVLPIELGNIGSLKKIHAEGLTVSKLPVSIGRLSKLVELILHWNKNLKTLPDNICNLRALEVLNIENCSSLEALPTELGNIGSLKMLYAERLTISKLPDSIGHLGKLVDLRLSHSKNLKALPDTICNLKALEVLSIGYRRNVDALPIEMGKIESLRKLYAANLNILRLPDSIGRLSKLVEMRLSFNTNLETLPDTICNLRALEVLSIDDCRSLKALPIELGNIESLKELNAKGLTISKLPDSIGRLSKLVELKLSYNNNLETLPDTICSLRALEVLSIDNCRSLEALPVELGNIVCLTKLNAWGLTVSKLPDSIGRLTKLVDMRLSCNNNLETLPDTICNLKSLENLDISRCGKLEILPNQVWKITRLRELDASGATLLKEIPDIDLSQALLLHRLDLSENILTTLPPGISQLSKLEYLFLKDCRHLLSISELPPNLKWIVAEGCTSMLRLLNLSNLKQLELLDLTNCSSLREIQGLQEITSITDLHLGGCNSSLLAFTFTKRFFQMYSGFGHEIKIYTPFAEIPDWIRKSTNLKSTASFDLPPNVLHNFLAMIICFKHRENNYTYGTTYSIKTITSDFIWSNTLKTSCQCESLMVIVPRSIFSVRGSDDRFELTANAEIFGIHLLTESTMVDESDSTTVNVEGESSYPCKRLKQLESDKS